MQRYWIHCPTRGKIVKILYLRFRVCNVPDIFHITFILGYTYECTLSVHNTASIYLHRRCGFLCNQLTRVSLFFIFWIFSYAYFVSSGIRSSRISSQKFPWPVHYTIMAEYRTRSFLRLRTKMAGAVIVTCALQHRQLRTKVLGRADQWLVEAVGQL